MIGVWSVLQWQQLGSPSKLNLVELGPGRGTLMADLLRGIKPLRPFSSALSVHLVEVSKGKKSLPFWHGSWHTRGIGTIRTSVSFTENKRFKYSSRCLFQGFLQLGKTTWQMLMSEISVSSYLTFPVGQHSLARAAREKFES